MQDNRRGRPPKPLDPDASQAARLGAELRARRSAQGLTLKDLAERTGFSSQHISSAELARAPVSGPFVAACDHALRADGALVRLFPAVIQEQAMLRHERSIARSGLPAALRCAVPHSEVGADVEPTNRRGLLGAGAATALGGLGAAAAVAPAAARDIDPALPAHWMRLLSLLGRHDALHGPYDVLDTVCHELSVIADHRQVARGKLRVELLRVESHWTGSATWLSNDAGQVRSRDAWTNRAVRLAQESDYPDMVAFAGMRRSQWAAQELDAPRAIAFAQDALGVSGTSPQTRALCALRAALGHALAGDGAACERSLAEAETLVAHTDSPTPPWAGGAVSRTYVQTAEARCWLWLQPRRAIGLYEDILHDWPRDRMRDGAVHQARLALACAAAGEHDRATAEGRKALAVARGTRSSVVTRELKRLGETLRAA
jgi:hypothetical protein